MRNVEHVSGVVNVVDLLTLKPRASAANVEERIKDALQRHATDEARNVKVSVAGGVVTLNGTVESLDEMDRIEDAAWAAPGVTRVVDNLRITH